MKTEKLTVTVELSEHYMQAFKAAVGYLREPHSKAAMTVDDLMSYLAEDLAQTQTRPGCWEAANMQQVIDGHGWELWMQEDEVENN